MSDVTPAAPPIQAPRSTQKLKPEVRAEVKTEPKPVAEDTVFPHVRAEIEVGQKALEAFKSRFADEQEAGRKSVELYKRRSAE